MGNPGIVSPIEELLLDLDRLWVARGLERIDVAEPELPGAVAYRDMACANIWAVALFSTKRFVSFVFPPMAFPPRRKKSSFSVKFVEEPLVALKVPSYFQFFLAKQDDSVAKDSREAFRTIEAWACAASKEQRRLHRRSCPNHAAPERILQTLLRPGSPAPMFACALDGPLPNEAFECLTRSRDALVLRAAACRENLPERHQSKIASNPSADVRALCALASRRDLVAEARAILDAVPHQAVHSYLRAPRSIEHIEEDGSGPILPGIVAMFDHFLGDRPFPGASAKVARLLGHFTRERDLSRVMFLAALVSQGLASSGVQRFLSRIFPEKIQADDFRDLAERLRAAAGNARELGRFKIKPFSFLIQYSHIWPIRDTRPELDFELALEYDPLLYYPDRIRPAEIDARRAKSFSHLRHAICWCRGMTSERSGIKELFLFELQSDLHLVRMSQVDTYFRDWPKLLLRLAIAEAKRRDVQAVHVATARDLRRMYGVNHTRAQTLAWDGIYDDGALGLGMRPRKIPEKINIHPSKGREFLTQRFYAATIAALPQLTLTDSARTTTS